MLKTGSRSREPTAERMLGEVRQSSNFGVAKACAVIACVLILMVLGQNFLIANYLPHLERFTTDFSPAYLDRELSFLSKRPAQTIFLGDSVLWGYKLRQQATAVSIMAARGCPCRNLAFKSSSPANYYALSLLMLHKHVRPNVIVLEVNDKVLNAADSSYQTLHPAVASLVEPLLSPDDRAKLAISGKSTTFAARLEQSASSFSTLYAMRSDIRETLLGEPDTLGPLQTAGQPPAEPQLAGTYDLSPLDETNVGVYFLEKTLSLLRTSRVPVVAFMTPTNHQLLHQYIDTPEYRFNQTFLKRTLARYGSRIVDLDGAFSTSDFIDYDHLTARGQQRLAVALGHALTD